MQKACIYPMHKLSILRQTCHLTQEFYFFITVEKSQQLRKHKVFLLKYYGRRERSSKHSENYYIHLFLIFDYIVRYLIVVL